MLDLSEQPLAGDSFETAEAIDDEDVQWEEDDADAQPAQSTARVIGLPLNDASAPPEPTPALPVAAPQAADAAPMDMDMGDSSDDDNAPAAHTHAAKIITVKREGNAAQTSNAATITAVSSAVGSTVSVSRSLSTVKHMEDAMTDATSFSRIDRIVSPSHAADRDASSLPERQLRGVQASVAAVSSDVPAAAPRALADSDPLVLDLPSDDEETARDRATLHQLLGELDELQDSLKAAEQMEGQPGTEPIVDITADKLARMNTAAASEAGGTSRTTAAGDAEQQAAGDVEEEKQQVEMLPADAAVSEEAAFTLAATTVEPVPNVRGLGTALASKPRDSASGVLSAERAIARATEAQAERERRAAMDARDASVLGQPMSVEVAPASGASVSSGRDVGWQAFPEHLSTEEAVGLSNSFDSTYLETNAAAKAANEARRGMEHVTEDMIAESKELLQMCGIPFIEAPGEAEAQCAALEQLGLVSGVVTDDSDVFLFGAQQVYRHLFESKQYCESYRVREIESKLGMDRLKLIHFALLLGSDYTEGVKGVGIVNATEILNAFPGPNGLEDLRQWVYSDELDEAPVLPQLPDDVSDEERARVAQEYRIAHFKHAHRRIKRNWGISTTFPNRAVIEAYLQPNVDRSEAEFSWRTPDWEALAGLCGNKLGWSADQIAQNLSPVVKAMEASSGRQGALDRFFLPNDQFAAIGSTRLNLAVRGLVNQSLTAEELAHQQDTQARKEAQAEKRRQKAREKAAQKRAAKATAGQAVDGDGSDADVVEVGAAASSAGQSLLDDDFALSAADEARLAAIEAQASPVKTKPAAGASAQASPAAAKTRRPRKRKDA